MDFPKPGQTVVGIFSTGPGGKGSNQAIAAGRTGTPTLFIGAIGQDTFGEGAKEFYKSEKIAANLIEKPKLSTGTAAILVSDTGQNEIVVSLGANAVLSKTDVDAKVLDGAKIVVTQLEANVSTTAHTLRTARKAGLATLLNPAPMRSDFDPALLKATDILIPNESEFAELVNLLGVAPTKGKPFTEKDINLNDQPGLQQLCRKFGVPVVIITLGSRGCFVSQSSGHTHISAHSGIKVVDTTGAGDAFVGGFAAGYIKSAGNIVSAAKFGNAVAALSVTKPGTAPAMPRKDEIDAFMARVRLTL